MMRHTRITEGAGDATREDLIRKATKQRGILISESDDQREFRFHFPNGARADGFYDSVAANVVELGTDTAKEIDDTHHPVYVKIRD